MAPNERHFPWIRPPYIWDDNQMRTLVIEGVIYHVVFLRENIYGVICPYSAYILLQSTHPWVRTLEEEGRCTIDIDGGIDNGPVMEHMRQILSLPNNLFFISWSYLNEDRPFPRTEQVVEDVIRICTQASQIHLNTPPATLLGRLRGLFRR